MINPAWIIYPEVSAKLDCRKADVRIKRFRINMNHLTGMILPGGEERVAWRCVASAKMFDDVHGSKAPGLRWVKSAPRGRCGACPMQMHRAAHRAAHRAYPENRFVPIKLIHIYPEPL
ncbi:MAG: hypothetical protein VB959_19275 [Rhodospirillales bacterium]